MVRLERQHIAIEGPIGVGKTTLAQAMADRLGAATVLERTDDNPFIEYFYQDPERHALSVQLSFLFSRLKQWQGIHQQELFSTGIVSDYLFAKDRLFATITLSDEELALYEQVARLVSVDIPKPDLVIYLQADVDALVERVGRRNREMESSMTQEYIRTVAAAYDRFFFHYQETPLFIVQTNKLNFAEKPEDVDALLDRIRHMRSDTEFWADYS